MNEFELWDPNKGPDVSFAAAPVSFPAYEVYKKQAQEIADYIGGLEVTEDNVKQIKQELASCRKVTDELNRRRIAIKKMVLKDFNEFEAQVKDLIFIVDEADSQLRTKVRQMEEEEREAKRQAIKDIWDKRIGLYSIGKVGQDPFGKFCIPRYLNKTTSMKVVEKDMTEWLEMTEMDLSLLLTMGPEYQAEYGICYNTAKAIRNVNDRKTREEVAEKAAEEEIEETAVFTVYGAKNIAFARTLLDTNWIKYKEGK